MRSIDGNSSSDARFLRDSWTCWLSACASHQQVYTLYVVRQSPRFGSVWAADCRL